MSIPSSQVELSDLLVPDPRSQSVAFIVTGSWKASPDSRGKEHGFPSLLSVKDFEAML